MILLLKHKSGLLGQLLQPDQLEAWLAVATHCTACREGKRCGPWWIPSWATCVARRLLSLARQSFVGDNQLQGNVLPPPPWTTPCGGWGGHGRWCTASTAGVPPAVSITALVEDALVVAQPLRSGWRQTASRSREPASMASRCPLGYWSESTSSRHQSARAASPPPAVASWCRPLVLVVTWESVYNKRADIYVC